MTVTALELLNILIINIILRIQALSIAVPRVHAQSLSLNACPVAPKANAFGDKQTSPPSIESSSRHSLARQPDSSHFVLCLASSEPGMYLKENPVLFHHWPLAGCQCGFKCSLTLHSGQSGPHGHSVSGDLFCSRLSGQRLLYYCNPVNLRTCATDKSAYTLCFNRFFFSLLQPARLRIQSLAFNRSGGNVGVLERRFSSVWESHLFPEAGVLLTTIVLWRSVRLIGRLLLANFPCCLHHLF